MNWMIVSLIYLNPLKYVECHTFYQIHICFISGYVVVSKTYMVYVMCNVYGS